jgi:hypothetical protein
VTTASFTALERWVMLVASAWLVTGLQLDAYAHATTPELETFWTPWHAVLYSGIAVSGLTLVWLLRSRLPRIPTYETVLALPNALRVPMLGMAFLLVGGGIDTLWHNVFGIEQGLEIFVSPSHEMIILGMFLVAMGPALMLATSSGNRLKPSQATLVTISALLSALPLHIYSLHASVFGNAFFGSSPDAGADGFDGFGGERIYSTSAQVFHGYLASTVLLLLPIVLIGRRWRLPIGVPTVLVAFPAFAMHLMFFSQEPEWWIPITISAATAGVELLFRLLKPIVPLPGEAGWVVLGGLAPALVWTAYFAVADAQVGVHWNVHIVTGLLTYSAIFGVVTVLVARHVRPPARVPAAGSETGPAPTPAPVPEDRTEVPAP